MTFADREEAGRILARALGPRLAGVARDDALVLGVPRGGVAVAAEVARALGLDLDILVVRRLVSPHDARVTLGAVGEGDVLVVDDAAVLQERVGPEELAALVQHEHDLVARSATRWRHGVARRAVSQRVVIVVDDGICTGATSLATVRAVLAERPRRIVVAAPVGAPSALARVRAEVSEVVCLEEPPFMLGLGSCYERFGQVDDDDVAALLERARADTDDGAHADTDDGARERPP